MDAEAVLRGHIYWKIGKQCIGKITILDTRSSGWKAWSMDKDKEDKAYENSASKRVNHRNLEYEFVAYIVEKIVIEECMTLHG